MENEFEVEENLSAEDFKGEEVRTVYPMTADEINRAAIAVLNTNNPVNSFVDIAQERAMGNNSSSLKSLEESNVQETQEKIQQEIPDLLADESISLEEKQAVITGLQDPASPTFSQRNIAASNMLAKGVENEELNREEQSIALSDKLANWNKGIEQEQQAVTLFAASIDPETNGTVKSLLDIVSGIAPFTESLILADVLGELSKEGLIPESESLLPSTMRSEIRTLVRKGSLEENKKMLEHVVDLVSKTKNPWGVSDNRWAQLEALRSMFEDEYSTEFTEFASDTAAVLDMVSVIIPPAKMIPKAVAAAKGTKVVADTKEVFQNFMSKVRRATVKGKKAPTSPAEMAAHLNPDQARAYHELLDAGDEDLAKALYGTDRNSAILDDVMPDPTSPTGELSSKVNDVDAFVDEIKKIQETSGRTGITIDERELARVAVAKKLAKGGTGNVSFRANVSQFGDVDESARFQFEAVYGATDTAGFSSVDEALEQTRFALRRYGVADEDLTIMVRNSEGKYIPEYTEAARFSDNKDFLVKAKLQHEITPADIKNFGAHDAKLVTASLIDRFIPALSGKVSGFVKTMDATFEKYLQTPIFAEAERTTRMGDVFKRRIEDFTVKLKDLTDGQLESVQEYITKANLEGIKFDRRVLRREGWSTKEIDAVLSFRNTHDGMWKLDNLHKVKSMRTDGYGKVTIGEETHFFGKEVSKESAGLDGFFYHADLDETLPLANASKLGAEFQDHKLYKLPLRLPEGDGGFEYVLTKEKNWRGLRDSDVVVNYRDGYFNVDYIDPYFIKKVKGTGGRAQAISTAGDLASANREVARLMASNTDDTVSFIVVNDAKRADAFKREVDAVHGRLDMKFRGKRLKSGNGASDEQLRAPIQNPLSAMIKSAEKLTQRLGMDEVYSTLEARFVGAFGDLVQGKFPRSVDEIGTNVAGQGRRIADAKVMFNWMEAQRRPDLPIADRAIQSTLTALAESLDTKKWAPAGASAMARKLATTEPVTALKSTVFQVYVALNPQRQLTLGVLDSLKAAAIAPVYMARLGAFRDSTGMALAFKGHLETAAKVSGRSVQDIKKLADEFARSGLSSGIQQQKLVQAGIKTSTTEVPLKEALGKRKLDKLTSIPSKIMGWNEMAGFQTAEHIQNAASWLAFREAKASKLKRFNLTKFELDEVTAEARVFAYSQTKAAAPSYNAALSVVTQFAAVSHKAIALTLPQALGGSKSLTAWQKVKLNGFFTAAYGGLVSDVFDKELIKIEDEAERETFRNGLVWLTAHALMGASISTTSLNPADYLGLIERVRQVVGGEWAEASPAVGVGLKVQGVGEALMGILGEGNMDALGLDTADGVKSMLKAFAEFYPGASKAWKAAMMAESDRLSSKHNFTQADNASIGDIKLNAFGFSLLETENKFQIFEASKASYEEKENDVKEVMNNFKRLLSLNNISNKEGALRISLSSAFYTRYDDDLEAKEMLHKEVQKLLTQDDKEYQNFTRLIGMMPAEDFLGLVNISTLTEEQKEFFRDTVGPLEDLRKEIKSENK